MLAIVDKPWPVTCLVEGDLSLYGEGLPIGYLATLEGDEDFSSASVQPLSRSLNINLVMNVEYYLRRNGKWEPKREDMIAPPEVFGPPELDPRAPAPPIEGTDYQPDGSFKFTIRMFDLRGESPKLLDTEIVPGIITCPQCML
jgi:hypothetical protein